MTEPFAVDVEDHGQLVAAFRARIEQLNISQETVELIGGLCPGYLAKALNPAIKKTTPYIIFLIASSLGLRLTLTEDPEAVARLGKRWEQRKTRKHKRQMPGGCSHPIRFELGPDFLRRIQIAGGKARQALPNAAELNRRAALARWRKARQSAPA
jgi:hypothetical protein